jgi:hypothetical protein
MQMAAGRRPAWLTFVAVLLFALSATHTVYGISLLSDSVKVQDLTGGLFGDDLVWWGLIDVGLAILAFFAAFSLLQGNAFGRLVAYIWAIFALVRGFLAIGQAPWWAVAMIALSVIVMWALAATEEWRAT